MTDVNEIEILLVEDNPTDAELTLRALRKHNLSNQVTWVQDGAEALDFIYCTGQYSGRVAKHLALVLLDLKLPKVDGIQVLRRIKSDERTKAIPVVVLTSSAEDRDILDSYQFGVNSYLVKPVVFDAFMEVVTKAGFYWLILNRT